jgi:hypothetical protein
VLLAPTDDVRDVIRAFHSRPLRRGFRAVLVPETPWREILREVLTEERSLPQDLATWMMFGRRHHRLDREILEAIFSLPRNVSLVKGLGHIASTGTVATHLTRLHLPPASKLKTLGLAVRACMRLQRNPHATIESVAISLGYASGAAVSLLISRTFGAATREVREKLGWEWLMGRWESWHGR